MGILSKFGLVRASTFDELVAQTGRIKRENQSLRDLVAQTGRIKGENQSLRDMVSELRTETQELTDRHRIALSVLMDDNAAGVRTEEANAARARALQMTFPVKNHGGGIPYAE